LVSSGDDHQGAKIPVLVDYNAAAAEPPRKTFIQTHARDVQPRDGKDAGVGRGH